MKPVSRTAFLDRWFVITGIIVAATSLTGCSSNGEGSITIGDPASVRAKVEGAKPASGASTPKQADALKAEGEAAKKFPKLH
jgi:hypothetical protein